MLVDLLRKTPIGVGHIKMYSVNGRFLNKRANVLTGDVIWIDHLVIAKEGARDVFGWWLVCWISRNSIRRHSTSHDTHAGIDIISRGRHP
jgi:hypothetical protein